MYSAILAVAVLAMLAPSFAAYAGPNQGNNVGNYGGGYGGGGQPFGMFPFQFPMFDFSELLQGLNMLQRQMEQAMRSEYGGQGGYPASGGYAPQSQGYQPSAGGRNGNAQGAQGQQGGYGAGASANIGPNGGRQKAYLTPENPASPNVDKQLPAGASGGQSSYRSVHTSSSSGSRNDNGKKSSYRTATTTVNDNGKISTHTVRD